MTEEQKLVAETFGELNEPAAVGDYRDGQLQAYREFVQMLLKAMITGMLITCLSGCAGVRRPDEWSCGEYCGQANVKSFGNHRCVCSKG
jgi:hypothetical protein